MRNLLDAKAAEIAGGQPIEPLHLHAAANVLADQLRQALDHAVHHLRLPTPEEAPQKKPARKKAEQ